MTEPSASSHTLLCPSCGTENPELSPSSNNPTAFCLQCRFPLLLVAGKYRLVRVMGRGGFGTVYEGRHIYLNREEERVIKVLHPELLEEENARRRFMREIQVTCILSQRNHHIVRVYDDFGQIPELGFYYVMECLRGIPVDRLLAQQPLLPLSEVYHLFDQLCIALDAAHGEGIVHRDLKPANLYIVKHLEDPLFLKVLDFGVAKALQGAGDTGRLTEGAVGTPAYMSPEQCANEEIGPASDMYAMGVILFEWLAGFLPFASADMPTRSAAELFTAHLTKTPPRLHDVLPAGREVPFAMSDVLAKALAKEPEQRHGSVRALREAFHDAIGLAADGAARISTLPLGSGSRWADDILPEGLRDTLVAGAGVASALPSAESHLPDILKGDGGEVRERTNPSLRRIPTPYEPLSGVALELMSHEGGLEAQRHTPSPRLAVTMQQGPMRDATLELSASAPLSWRWIALIGSVIFVLSGVAAWWFKHAAKGSVPMDSRSASLGQKTPVKRVIVRRGVTVRRAVPALRRSVPVLRRRVVVRRMRSFRTRKRVLARRRAPRSPVKRALRPRKRASGVAGCPVWKGRQIFVRFARNAGVVLSLQPNDGRIVRHDKGFCVGVTRRATKLLIRGRRKYRLTSCTVVVWELSGRVRLKMHERFPDALEPDSMDYCQH